MFTGNQIENGMKHGKGITPAHHAFQAGKVQICISIGKFFGLLFFNNDSSNR